jgi:Ca2+-binding EF-hand superfamily protein
MGAQLSRERNAKLSSAFKSLDANQSGFLELDQILNLRNTSELGVNKESVRAAQKRAILRELEALMLAFLLVASLGDVVGVSLV